MKANDIEALGALYTLLTEQPYRVEPRIPFLEIIEFVRRYFDRCLREDPRGEWSDSRYSAGWDLVGWFSGLFDDKTVPRETMMGLKQWLGDLYRGADHELRLCIETATLEHLFEHAGIATFFADWEADPALGVGYRAAKGWADGGGSSPLTGS